MLCPQRPHYRRSASAILIKTQESIRKIITTIIYQNIAVIYVFIVLDNQMCYKENVAINTIKYMCHY